MFLKITKSKKHQYLSIVESYRESGKVKHRQIFSFGRLDDFKKNPGWKKVAKELLSLLGSSPIFADDPDGIEELERVCWGAMVYRKMWDQFDLSSMLRLNHKHKFRDKDHEESIFIMMLDRLLCPQSKRASYMARDRYAYQGKLSGLEYLQLQNFYRALDYLADAKEDLEDQLFEKNKNLFNMKIDVVFYDVTTFHFESIVADSLKDFGFSKAGKFNEVQIVMGLLVDQEGRPIGFDLFPGNTYEGHTMIEALEKLKNRFSIQKVIIVADRGMNSKMNLATIKKAGFDYIVGAPLKNLKQSLEKQVLDKEGYLSLQEHETAVQHDSSIEEEENAFQYKKIHYPQSFKIKAEHLKHDWQTSEFSVGDTITLEHTLITTYSDKRARKNAKDRERLVQKAKDLLVTPSLIKNKKGAKRFVDYQIEDQPVLNQEAIEKDARFDGFYGILASNDSLKPGEIIEQYHQLWRIEECFRVLKSSMRSRPIFHWTPKRIKGHFVLCFIAFLLERTLELTMKENNISASPLKIQQAINSLELSKIKIQEQYYYLKAKPTPLANQIIKTLRISSPKNLAPLHHYPF